MKIFPRALLLGSLFCSAAYAAAPTFDESPGGTNNVSVTTHSATSFTSVTGGSFIIIGSREAGTGNLIDTCTSAVDGSMPIITDGTDIASQGSTGNRLEVYGRPNATAGADAQSCTSSASASSRVLDAIYDGVHTTVPYGNVVIGTASATTTPSIAITTTWSDALVLCLAIADTAGAIVAGDTETLRQTYNSRISLEDINATTPGSFTCNWSTDASSDWAMVAIELKSTTSTVPSGGLLLRRRR